MRCLLLISLAFLGGVVAAEKPVIGEDIAPFGSQTVWPSDPHLEEYLDHMVEMGIRVGRFDLCWWGMCETEEGVYNFASAEHVDVGPWNTDRMIAMMREREIEPYAILCYGNPIHIAEDALFTPEAMEAFGEYCAQAVTRYREDVKIWEIWNEPNLENFWGGGRPISAENYAQLAIVAARRIRDANPDAIIVAPALSWIKFQPEFIPRWIDFLEGCGEQGLFELVDAVSIHPYRVDEMPESVNPEYAMVRELIARHTDRDVMLWAGEWGFKTIWSEVDEHAQAAYLQRMVLNNLSQGVDMTIWFSLKDYQSAGLLDEEMNPRPSYQAMRVLNELLEPPVRHIPFNVYGMTVRQVSGELSYPFINFSYTDPPSDLRIETFQSGDRFVSAFWRERLAQGECDEISLKARFNIGPVGGYEFIDGLTGESLGGVPSPEIRLARGGMWSSAGQDQENDLLTPEPIQVSDHPVFLVVSRPVTDEPRGMWGSPWYLLEAWDSDAHWMENPGYLTPPWERRWPYRSPE